MKLQSNNLLENLNSQEVKNLLSITRETVDKQIKKRIFTAAELMRIQKSKRNFSVRRFVFA